MDDLKTGFDKIFEQFTEANGDTSKPRKSLIEMLNSTMLEDNGE